MPMDPGSKRLLAELNLRIESIQNKTPDGYGETRSMELFLDIRVVPVLDDLEYCRQYDELSMEDEELRALLWRRFRLAVRVLAKALFETWEPSLDESYEVLRGFATATANVGQLGELFAHRGLARLSRAIQQAWWDPG